MIDDDTAPSNFDELPDSHRERILTASINLMRSITEAYGADRGMAIWESIADAIGPEVKGKIFFGLITGELGGDVVVSRLNPDRFIDGIKVIRNATGMGLKETKDLLDHCRNGNTVHVAVPPDLRSKMVSDLRNLGHVAT